MKIVLFFACALFAGMAVTSCSNEDDLTTASVSDTQTDMEVLSRFIDVNEATNEYYINENKKTRALSYVSDSDWQALQNVSPVNLEKCKKDLQALNEQVAEAVSDPKVAYMVFSVNGKTIVKNLRNAKFGFEKSEGTAVSSRTIPSTLMVYGGSEQTTTPFKDPSRTIRMTVEKDPFVTGYYFFQILSPNAKVNPDDNTTTPESVAFSGTGSLFNTSFTWTAYYDALENGQYNWEFKAKGSTPSYGTIATCRFSK